MRRYSNKRGSWDAGDSWLLFFLYFVLVTYLGSIDRNLEKLNSNIQNLTNAVNAHSTVRVIEKGQ
jgi:hypothetical protein